MSAPEIGHRIVELGRKTRFRSEKRGWDAIIVPSDEMFTKLPDLRKRLRQTPARCGQNFDPTIAFGQRWPSIHFDTIQPRESLWRFDPVSQRDWPGIEQAAFDIDVRSTSAVPDQRYRYGDVKFVWEPARLQALHWFAVRVAQGDQAAFDDGMAWVNSWMAVNPPWRGVHWTSGIEIALRIVSVVLLISAADVIAINRDHRQILLRFLHGHAHWLTRFPSLHSSANNHRVAEGLGLLLAGLILPVSAEARGYAEEGRHILEEEAALQILPDGVGTEQSPTYQAFTMEMLALGQLVAQSLGQPLDHVVDNRLRCGVTFLAALQDDNGAVPAIGDDDEGRVVTCSGQSEPLYVASVVHAIAGLLQEPSLSLTAPGYLREALFVAPAAFAPAPIKSVRDFGQGGYLVVHDEALAHRYHLIFDRGPLGYLSLAAHGHADALALWLNVDGEPVLIDAGTWLYHSGRDKRRDLRSSQAHNTLTVHDRSQSEPSSAFSWKSIAKTEATSTLPQLWSAEGVHDGYARPFKLHHSRRIARSNDGFSILDRLLGAREALSCKISFLLAEDIIPKIEPGGISLWRDNVRILKINVPPLLTAQREQAVYAPAFGVLRTTQRIVLTGQIGEDGCQTEFSFAADAEQR